MKTLLITGASRGIGESIARAFSASGYNVVINYNKSKERAEALGKELGAPIFQADVSDINQARALVSFAVEKFGNAVEISYSRAIIFVVVTICFFGYKKIFKKQINPIILILISAVLGITICPFIA